jgi:hypothetical protein
VFEVFFPEGYGLVRSGVSGFCRSEGEGYGKYVVGEPVVFDAIDIFDRHCVVLSVSGVQLGGV